MSVPVTLFAGLAPLLSTERRSSVDMKSNDSKMSPVDQYGRSDSILTHLNSATPSIPTTPHCTTSGTCTSIPPTGFSDPTESDRDYNSLNTSFGNIQIDLDNLGAILGSTSITVCKPAVTGVQTGTTSTSTGEPSAQQSTENEPTYSDYR